VIQQLNWLPLICEQLWTNASFAPTNTRILIPSNQSNRIAVSNAAIRHVSCYMK